MGRILKGMLAAASRIAGHEAGSSSLEFAILCGPFLLLTLGTVEFARAAWMSQALEQSAYKVARCSALKLAECVSNGNYSQTRATTYATTVANGWGVPLAAPGVSISTGSCPGMSGQTAFVAVTLTQAFTSPMVSLVPSLGNVALHGVACFPVAPST